MVKVEKTTFNIHETDGTKENFLMQQKLVQLEELFEYTYEIKDVTGNMADIIRGLPQHVLNEIIRMLEIYKRELIEDSFKAFPMNADALNCRNGSVTVLGNLIQFLSTFKHKTQDMEYRDDGTLRQQLEKANKELEVDPIEIIKKADQMASIHPKL